MSRILRRPMFKMGGSTYSGIMTGLVDRKGYADDTGIKSRVVAKSARDYISEFNPLLQEFTPKTRLPLGAVGAALVSGTPMKDALISGYTDFTKRDDARTAGIQKGAVQLGLGQALKDMAPSNQSVLAAEKEARFLLPENATPAQIRAQTAELLNKKYTGVTYGPEAEYSRLKSDFFKLYNDEDQAQRHADFVTKVKPKLPDGQISRGRVTKDKKTKEYKFKKGPGVYIDTLDAKVILFTGSSFKELPELSALVR